MNAIHFYNKERNTVIELINLRFDKHLTNTVFVYFKGKINFDFFCLETDFEAEVFDFEDLLVSLRLMYEGKRKSANFNPLSPKIMIKFEFHDCGHILVKSRISNDIATCCLEFEYEIDQSFLPELIREIEIAISDG
ncbi:hypothetical protein AGMMS50262_23740 [Bacteroidia bacterium]|nr:hypothetical protein AGMMS50262_23740 [Bacteroidia bacterium]